MFSPTFFDVMRYKSSISMLINRAFAEGTSQEEVIAFILDIMNFFKEDIADLEPHGFSIFFNQCWQKAIFRFRELVCFQHLRDMRYDFELRKF